MRPKKQRSKGWKHGRAERRGKGEAGSGLAARWEGARPARGRSRGKLPHGSPSSARGEGLLQTCLDSEQFILFFFFYPVFNKIIFRTPKRAVPRGIWKIPRRGGKWGVSVSDRCRRRDGRIADRQPCTVPEAEARPRPGRAAGPHPPCAHPRAHPRVSGPRGPGGGGASAAGGGAWRGSTAAAAGGAGPSVPWLDLG